MVCSFPDAAAAAFRDTGGWFGVWPAVFPLITPVVVAGWGWGFLWNGKLVVSPLLCLCLNGWFDDEVIDAASARCVKTSPTFSKTGWSPNTTSGWSPRRSCSRRSITGEKRTAEIWRGFIENLN